MLFEREVLRLLGGSGYVTVTEGEPAGRSGSHGIRSFGTITFPTSFLYPTRLIGGFKFYAKNRVELCHIRDFAGIIGDIAESNFAFLPETANTQERFNYIGCYFSATAFAADAQEYAWAHDICMMSFEHISVLRETLSNISRFVGSLGENAAANITAQELIAGYDAEHEESGVSAMLGIANGVYPVMIFGESGWFKKAGGEDGRLVPVVSSRQETPLETIVTMEFGETTAELSLPSVVLGKLAKRSDSPAAGECMLRLEIPFTGEDGRRSFTSCDVLIDGYDASEYAYRQLSLI